MGSNGSEQLFIHERCKRLTLGDGATNKAAIPDTTGTYLTRPAILALVLAVIYICTHKDKKKTKKTTHVKMDCEQPE